MIIFTPNTLMRSSEVNANNNEIIASFAKCTNRQNNITNTVVDDQLIQTGWGYIQGDINAAIGETLTFPVAFDSAPILMVTSLQKRASIPTNIEDFNTYEVSVATCRSITSTSAIIIIHKTDGGATGSTNYYGYSWIAIGTKAR